MLLNGPSCGHDFDFHLLSWLEASTQFAHMHYPHWAYTPAFNAGEPRFVFYPPLSWALGALLGMALPWTAVPAAFTFIALTLSGFSMRRLASRYASPNAASLAAVLYVVNPYMLFTAYERTAYGELLAAAWIPLLLLAALEPRMRVVPLAVPVALLWLTNAPAAIMSCYALAFLAVIRLVVQGRAGEAQSSRAHLALRTAAATVLGLALSAFYLVPAVAERTSIQADMATIEGMRIAGNTLFHHMSPATGDNLAHDAVLHTASMVSVALMGALALAAIVAGRARLAQVGALVVLGAALAILLTRISLPLWNHTPELRFLQFPWRLDAIVAAILCLFAAIALSRFSLKPLPTVALALAVAAALTVPCWRLFHQPCDDEDTVQARVALYHSNLGTEPTDEYTPASADNDALAHGDPPYWVAPSPNAPAPNQTAPGQAPRHLVLDESAPAYLILNRRAYSSWQVTLNGRPVSTSDRDDGLIAVALPPGHDIIDLTERHTADQPIGLGVSLLSAFVLVWMGKRTPA